MLSNQKGFTLIELIVVIVVLGILAATALPKFVNLSGDARLAVMRGVEGSMRGANSIVYARAASAGQTGATGTITGPWTGNLDVVYGYAANPTDLVLAMDLSPSSDFNTTTALIEHTGVTSGSGCDVTYTAATSATVPPVYTFNATLANCS